MCKRTLILSLLTFIGLFIYSQQPELVIQQGHKSEILFDDFNREEAAWLTVDKNEAYLWNIPTARQLRRFSQSSAIRGAAFVKNGEEIALAAYDFRLESAIHFYNARTGEETGKVEIYDSTYPAINRRRNWKPIDQLVRNKSGERLAVRSFDRIYLVDVPSRRIVRHFNLPTYDGSLWILSNNNLCFAYKDSGRLILASYDREGNVISRSSIQKDLKPEVLTIHPRIPLIALGFKDGSILVMNEELQLEKEIAPQSSISSGAISGLDFNSSGTELLVSTNNAIYRYDLTKNKARKFETKNEMYGQHVAFSPTDENNILTYSGTVPYQYEWNTGKKVHNYFVNSPGIAEFFLNSSENRLISGTMQLDLGTGNSIALPEKDYDEKFLVPLSDSVMICSFQKYEYIKGKSVTEYGILGRNIRTGEIDFHVKLPNSSQIEFATVSMDKKNIAVSDDLRGHLFILSGERYSKLAPIKLNKGKNARGLAFSPDGKSLLAGSSNYTDTLLRYDLEKKSWSDLTGVEISVFTNRLPITSDSRYLLFRINDFQGSITVNEFQLGFYDLKENRITRKIILPDMISRIALSPDNGMFAVGLFNGNILLYNWNDSIPFYTYRPHNNVIDQIEFAKTRNWILSRADDGLLSIWDWKEKRKVVDLFNVYSADRAFAMVTAENYYMMPPGVIREVHFTKGFQTYSVSQFDLVLNRPDKVLERIGMADAELVSMYKKAIERRMKKNGIDSEAGLNLIELQDLIIENRKSIPSTTSAPILPLKLNTANKEVKEYLLYINNQLVEKAKPSASNAAEFKVELNAGPNNIELAYLTKKGIESLHERVEIKFEPATPVPSKRYYIGIGVSEYADSARNLRYAAKDVQDLQDKFRKSDSNTQVSLYLNKTATREELFKIKEQLARTSIHDQVIISFSGHGLLDTAYNFYFATHDMNFKDPAAKGFSYSDIESLFDNIPARKKLILIDACQSGSVEKELFTGEGSDEGGNDSVKAYSRGGISSEGLAQSDLTASIKLMQQYFADISKGKGAVVISASAGEENALESAEWKNGVFTFCFIQAVFEGKGDTNRDGHVSVSEVKEYMEKEVLRLTNGRQRPASRKENLEWDWWVK